MSYKVTGLKKWVHAMDPVGMTKEMKAQMMKASKLNGKLGEAMMRKAIKNGGFTANAALTQAIKGSEKPLVDGGTLFQAITSVVISWDTVFVGVMRTQGDAFNVGLIVYQGAQVNVTERMRGLFFVLWKASMGETPGGELTGRAAELWGRKPGGWYPLSGDKTKIIIPPRRWVDEAYRDPSIKRKIKANWARALKKTMKRRAKGR